MPKLRVRSARWMLVATLCVAGAAWAQAPVPSRPHPRLFMRPGDIAGYAAAARSPTSAARKLIDQCQRSIDQPSELLGRGGVDGDYWPAAAIACAFAYRVTGQKVYLTQAFKYWRVLLNDDQTISDGLGCTPEQVAKDWRKSWKGDYPSPPALITVTHDTWYPMRFFGPAVALAYDWLYTEADEPLRAQTRACLTGWIDGYTRFGYLREDPGANYHAGFVIAKTLGAIAIGSDGGADGHLWSEVVRDVFAKQLVGTGLAGSGGGLGQRAGLLVGGDWGSWQYGPLSVLEYAAATRALEDHGVPQPEMDAWLRTVMLRTLHGIVPRMDMQFTGNGDYEGEDKYAIYPELASNQIDAILVGPAPDDAAAWAMHIRQSRKLGGPRFWNALAELRQIAPRDYRAQTPPPPLWYLARGHGNLYVRTSWSEDALWAVFMSGTPTADHAHYAASNFVLSRGGDHLIVDSGNYGQFSTFGSNAISADSGAPGGYATTQGPWGAPSLPWVRATPDRVFAARADFARAFEYNGLPSQIKFARRDWVLLPEGEVVAIDRVRTGDGRNMYLNFHANTAGTLALDPAGVAVGTVGDSRLAIHRVRLSGGTPKITKARKSDCPGDCRYPCGSCTAARFDVDLYSVTVPGPFAVGIHVFDALGKAEAPAKVGSLNDAPFDAAHQNDSVLGAAVLRGPKPTFVVTSATDAHAKALTYGVPGSALSRHIVFDAPEAGDGTSLVTAQADAGRCVITVSPGTGGGTTGRPLIFELAAAAAGCKLNPASDAPAALPFPPSHGEILEDDPPTAPALRGGVRWWYRHLRVPAAGFVVLLLALMTVARWRRRASAS